MTRWVQVSSLLLVSLCVADSARSRSIASSTTRGQKGDLRRRRRVSSSDRGNAVIRPRRALKERNDDERRDDDWTDDRASVSTESPYEWATPSPSPQFIQQSPPPVQQEQTPPPPPPQESGDPNTDSDGSSSTATMTPMVPDEGTDDAMVTTGSTNVDSTEQEQVCQARAARRGQPLTTEYEIVVAYTMDVVLVDDATTSPIFAGMAVNLAVTDYLTRVYVDRFCETTDSQPSGTRRRTASSTTLSTQFASHIVWGVTGGITSRSEQSCEVEASTCHRLETSNSIYFGNSTSEFKDMATSILLDIASMFTVVDIVGEIQASGDEDTAAAIVGTTYVNGQYRGDDNGISVDKSSERDGLRPVGKAFLTLFLLALIGAVGFVGYKYGYPKLREHQWKRKHNSAPSPTTTRSSDSNSNGAPWTFPSSLSLDNIRQNVQRRVNAIAGSYDEKTPVQSSDESSVTTTKEAALLAEYDSDEHNRQRSDESPNILIEETTLSTIAPGDAAGTEMILDDLADPTSQSCTLGNTTSSFRMSPSKLPKIEERAAPRRDEASFATSVGDYNFSRDAFSFSDVNIIVDDSESVISASPMYLQAAKRSYTVPDTVNL